MIDYLFVTNPGVLHLQTEVLTANFILLAVCILAVFLLKKRREFIKINKEQRFALQKSFKINAGLSAAILVFIILRISQVNFFSMRFFAVALLAAVVVVFIVGIIKTIQRREFSEVTTVIPDEYSKYLPHKKKK